jgi:hypothetical protein
MKKQSSVGAVLAAVVITLIIAALTGWGLVALGVIHLSPSGPVKRDGELESASDKLGKAGGQFVCEVTVSTPQGALNSEPKVYQDMMVAGLEPEAGSGWYQGEYSITESRKGALKMEGTKAFVSRPAMFERFGQMVTQEEFTIDLADGAFVQTLTFRDGTRRHMIKGVCAKFIKAPFK